VKNKVALITGSARGLGKGYAEALLKRGAKVAISDILKVGEVTAEEFQSVYGCDKVVFIRTDVTKQEDVEYMISETIKQLGGLDIVINNAGIGGNFPLQKTMDINFFGLTRVCELAVQRMRKDKPNGEGGVIVNVSSVSGLYNLNACPNYFASKHAVIGYSGNYGLRLAQHESGGIRMVTLCPGCVKTELTVASQILEEQGDVRIKGIIQNFGGWTPVETVVDTCMRIIETDVPGGSCVRVDNKVTGIVDRDAIPFSPLP